MNEEEQKEVDKQTEKQKEFDKRLEDLKVDLNAIAKAYNVGFVSGIYFKEQDISGVFKSGELNHLEQRGLGAQVSNNFTRS